MTKNIFKIINLLSKSSKKNFFIITFFMTLSAIIDIVGLASVMPYISLLTDKKSVENNYFINKLIYIFSINDSELLVISVGCISIFILVFSFTFKAFTQYLFIRFSLMEEYRLSTFLFQGYLAKPYEWYLQKNTADLQKTILSETTQVLQNGLMPLLHLLSNSILVVIYILFMVYLDPIATISVIISFTALSSIIYFTLRSLLEKAGKERLLGNNVRYMAINDSLNAIKEIKFTGRYKYFIDRFLNSSNLFYKKQILALTAGVIPRYLIECVAFIIFLSLIFYIINTNSISTSLPIISAYAITGYRLMPAFQHIINNINLIKYSSPSVENMKNELKNINRLERTNKKNNIKIYNNISLNNLYFKYEMSQNYTLKNINIKIQNKITGIIGKSGSGKSTIIDILLGLLIPEGESIHVDDECLKYADIKYLQNISGYVPQTIHLLDDSIIKNIAFGFEENEINYIKIEKVSRIAQIHDFIVNELPEGYKTRVGDKGIRLSGGQRQRIGIARALYTEPVLLILDEATNALDEETELQFIKSVTEACNNCKIVMITHRLSSLKYCDYIYLINNGEIIDEGNYSHMLKSIHLGGILNA